MNDKLKEIRQKAIDSFNSDSLTELDKMAVKLIDTVINSRATLQIQSETLQLGRQEVIEEIRETMIKAIGAMKYAGFNYDGSKYDNFDKSITDSTGVSDSLYISINEIENLLNQLKSPSKV